MVKIENHRKVWQLEMQTLLLDFYKEKKINIMIRISFKNLVILKLAWGDKIGAYFYYYISIKFYYFL